MRWRAAVLWTVFALLLAYGGGVFLHACGFGLGALVSNYCPRAADASEFLGEAERGEALRRRVQSAEMRLAQKPSCHPLAPRPTPTPTFQRAQHPSVERGAKEGKVEVFLRWNTHDDVDLIISCPGGGQIGGQRGRPGSCGQGRVDVDANRNTTENVMDNPEEHAVWPSAVPAGEFRVEAILFRAVDSNRRQTIPFEMTFKIGEASKVCTGAVQLFPESEHRLTRDGQKLSSYDPYISWTPSQGLPSNCDWSVDEAHYCNVGECEKR